MRKNYRKYVYRKGGAVLSIGTAHQIAEELNIKPRTFYFYRSPAYKRRASTYKPENIIEILRAHECECELCEEDAVIFGTDEYGEEIPVCETCHQTLWKGGRTG